MEVSQKFLQKIAAHENLPPRETSLISHLPSYATVATPPKNEHPASKNYKKLEEYGPEPSWPVRPKLSSRSCYFWTEIIVWPLKASPYTRLVLRTSSTTGTSIPQLIAKIRQIPAFSPSMGVPKNPRLWALKISDSRKFYNKLWVPPRSHRSPSILFIIPKPPRIKSRACRKPTPYFRLPVVDTGVYSTDSDAQYSNYKRQPGRGKVNSLLVIFFFSN